MTKQEARWTLEYVVLPEAIFGENILYQISDGESSF